MGQDHRGSADLLTFLQPPGDLWTPRYMVCDADVSFMWQGNCVTDEPGMAGQGRNRFLYLSIVLPSQVLPASPSTWPRVRMAGRGWRVAAS